MGNFNPTFDNIFELFHEKNVGNPSFFIIFKYHNWTYNSVSRYFSYLLQFKYDTKNENFKNGINTILWPIFEKYIQIFLDFF